MTDKFKAKSDLLRGEAAKRGMEELAIVVAREFGFDAAQDVLSAIVLGLDGGPEQHEELARKILVDIHSSDDMSRTREITIATRQFIEEERGWFDYDKLDRELNIKNPKHKAHRRKMIQRMVGAGMLEAHPVVAGRFRRVEGKPKEMNWRLADFSSIYKLKWPFGMEKLVNVYPKNIIVLAGGPDSGKTAFLFNFIAMNMEKFKINYYTSEMAEQEMYTRLSKFRTVPIDSWGFKTYERTSDFDSIIEPDEINIIDFLEISDTFYVISEKIRRIFDVLNKGICVIAIQKKKPQQGKDGKLIRQDLGRGAEFGLEKPRLYLSMDGGTKDRDGELRIVKAKNWASIVNPNGMVYKFKIVDGCKFIETNQFDDYDTQY